MSIFDNDYFADFDEKEQPEKVSIKDTKKNPNKVAAWVKRNSAEFAKQINEMSFEECADLDTEIATKIGGIGLYLSVISANLDQDYFDILMKWREGLGGAYEKKIKFNKKKHTFTKHEEEE